jgi:hypothetical protein
MTVRKDAVLYVRPSTNNLHTFTATENSCFFDICLPNYTQSSHLRKITYFKDVKCGLSGTRPIEETMRPTTTRLIYDATAPKLPSDFVIKEVDYRGSFV